MVSSTSMAESQVVAAMEISYLMAPRMWREGRADRLLLLLLICHSHQAVDGHCLLPLHCLACEPACTVLGTGHARSAAGTPISHHRGLCFPQTRSLSGRLWRSLEPGGVFGGCSATWTRPESRETSISLPFTLYT